MSKVIIEKLTKEQQTARGISKWPIWEKEISEFDWYYDSEEECQILEGKVVVETAEGNFTIQKGDFVTFKEGLKCKWKISEPIRKHYNFK
ncbi:MAG: cupin [Bacteroidetes bacterium GWA2_31_9]|nr:MAG: cupin [Bacteroidetes bacterium GWA2_31_9]